MLDQTIQNELLELSNELGINISQFLGQSDKYKLPVEGQIISTHAPGAATPTHPKGHFGLDIMNEAGTPVYAIGPGEVVQITTETDNPKGGNAVSILHEDGKIKSYYAHLDTVYVSVGDEVDQNTTIGTVGTSGMIYNGKKRITSPHLHFQVKVNGSDIDPKSIANIQMGSLASDNTNSLTKIATELMLKYSLSKQY